MHITLEVKNESGNWVGVHLQKVQFRGDRLFTVFYQSEPRPVQEWVDGLSRDWKREVRWRITSV